MKCIQHFFNFTVNFINSLYLGSLKAVPFPSWCYETAKAPESCAAAAQCVILMCLQITRRETQFSPEYYLVLK